MGLIVGIDPGITGAIAAVDGRGRLEWVHDMPVRDAGRKARKGNEIDGAALAHLLRIHVPDIVGCTVERVGSMPRDGGVQGMSLGDSAGCIRGVLEALGIGYERVLPQVWKRGYGLIGMDKDASRACAIRLYPGCTDLGRKRDHGRAEAILLARWAQMRHAGGQRFLEAA